MPESIEQTFTKEEEFLAGYFDAAMAAAELLEGDWRPNPACNEQTRKSRAEALAKGELARLAFERANVAGEANGFSTVEILLRSSRRTIKIQVMKADDTVTAEIVEDREGK